MKYIILFTLLLTSLLNAEDLKIKANSFKADENTGISVFSGDVNIIKKRTLQLSSKINPFGFIAAGRI